MEGRMKKCRQSSPDKTRVRAEPSPRHHHHHHQLPPRKVPVVYYLCRNRHLEHPHFIEVPLSSSQGLYLRDVINRLTVLRGKGMPPLYSWSCKRSYKNRFVWHDLSEDDLILPAHGNEYVLKGSEILDETHSDRLHLGDGKPKSQNLKQLQEPISSRSPEASSSSSSMARKEPKSPLADQMSPPMQPKSSTSTPMGFANIRSPPWGCPLSLAEYKVYRANGAVDASTQTEDRGKRCQARETCTRGVSTDEELSALECSRNLLQNSHMKSKENSEISVDEISLPPSSSSTSSGGKTDTLESLIRAEACKINSFRILEEEEVYVRTDTKLKASSVIMQLISCGSISVKDHHSFGLIPTYKPSFTQVKLRSPFLSSSVMLGELDCFAENPRLMGLKFEDKEYFSGSLIETKKQEEAGYTVLKRSSSYNAETCNSSELTAHGDTDSTHVKRIPRAIKNSCKHSHPRNETVKSPVSQRPRNSSESIGHMQSTTHIAPKEDSRRITDPSSGKKCPKRLELDEEMVVKIEES